MKLGFLFAAALGLVAATTTVSPLRADEDISKQFVVSAVQGKGGKIEIVVKPANDKVFINSEYSLKIHVTAKEGGTVDKSDLTKEDGKYEKSTHEGKANKVTFQVNANKGVSGEGKLVVCSLEACGNPTKFSFESK